MPVTDRSSSFPRAVAVMVVSLAALGGCVAAPLLQLAATPGLGSTQSPQAVPCTAGVTTAGCNTSATGSMIPGMASLMQVLAPATQPAH
jgi:hypothetical protein